MAKLEQVLDGVWRWSWYSEEKGMDFNGYAVRGPRGMVLIDPVCAPDDAWAQLAGLGRPAEILLTNKDHERASDELRRRFSVSVAIHEADAPLLAVRPERTFKDGELCSGFLEAFRFRSLKSPGECAFLWRERRLLFVGDALAGRPPGGLGLVKKHDGRPGVLEELRALLSLDFSAILVGDGEPILKDGKESLRLFLDGVRS